MLATHTTQRIASSARRRSSLGALALMLAPGALALLSIAPVPALRRRR